MINAESEEDRDKREKDSVEKVVSCKPNQLAERERERELRHQNDTYSFWFHGRGRGCRVVVHHSVLLTVPVDIPSVPHINKQQVNML